MIRIILAAAGLAVITAAIYLIGPRVAMNASVNPAPELGPDLDAWLAEREARFDNVRPGLEKEIVWVDPAARGRTPLAIVYVHGFSASKGELRPLPDLVADELGANLHFTRLAGHGQDGAALAEATLGDWIDDMVEALAIGNAIGERTIVVATSTGAALASWAAGRPELKDRIAALVLISPNYAVNATGAGLLAGPWGGHLAHLFSGPERGFDPANGLQAHLWTTRYPTAAILPMAGIVQMAARAPVEQIEAPALFVYSSRDRVVDARATAAIAERWGGPSTSLLIENSQDPSNHVIAGDAYSPATTEPLAREIVDWVRSTLD